MIVKMKKRRVMLIFFFMLELVYNKRYNDVQNIMGSVGEEKCLDQPKAMRMPDSEGLND